jgi:hypothetical protein
VNGSSLAIGVEPAATLGPLTPPGYYEYEYVPVR